MKRLAALGLVLAACAELRPIGPPVAPERPTAPPAAPPAPALTVESLRLEEAAARAEADRWTRRWKTAQALGGAMERGRPAEEIARRRAEYEAARGDRP